MEGHLVIFEGAPGTPRATHIGLLEEALGAENVVISRELGGTLFGDGLRDLLETSGRGEIPPELWVAAIRLARIVNERDNIVPALEEGKIAILDRSVAANYAIQVVAEQKGGMHTEVINEAQRMQKYNPLYIMFAEKAKVIWNRWKHDQSKQDTNFSVRSLEYCEAMCEGFRMFPKYIDGCKWRAVDAGKSEDELREEIFQHVVAHIGFKP